MRWTNIRPVGHRVQLAAAEIRKSDLAVMRGDNESSGRGNECCDHHKDHEGHKDHRNDRITEIAGMTGGDVIIQNDSRAERKG